MIQVFVVTFLFLFLSWNWGKMFAKLFNLSYDNKGIYLMLGMIILVACARIVHFWFPVNALLLTVFLIISLLYFIINRKDPELKELFKITQQNIILFIPIALFCIGFASLISISYDEGLYHAGFIQWSNTYPIVKGLANVHGRFGFNSNWHLLSALFNGFPFWKNSVNAINVGLVLSVLIYLFFEIEQKRLTKWVIPMLFFPLILIYHLIDPSADFAIMLFTFIFVISLVNKEQISKNELLFWLITLAFLLTVKLNITMLFLVFFFFIFKNKREFIKFTRTEIIWSLVFLVVIIVPWLLSNIVISGYLIYPYLPSPFGQEIWFVPRIQALDEISKINDALVVRWSGISFEDAAGLSHLEKWLLYFRSVRIVEKMVLLFSLSSAIYLVFKSIFTKKDMVFSFLLATTLIIQIYFVPDLRFFAGTLVAVVYLLFFNNLNKSSIFQRTYIIKTVVAVEIVLSLLLYRHLASSFGYSNENVLIKKAIYPREKLKTISIDETKFYVPIENEYCWNKIPCILTENPNLHLLGPKVKDGFYQKDEAAY